MSEGHTVSIYAPGHAERARLVGAWLHARALVLAHERPDLDERQALILAVEQWNDLCAEHEREINHRN